MAATVKKTGSKKSKRNVPNGVVHIQSTFNNTIVSITDTSDQIVRRRGKIYVINKKRPRNKQRQG